MNAPSAVPGPAPLSLPAKVALGLEILAAYARVRWWLWRSDFRVAIAAIRTRSSGVSQSVVDPQLTGAHLGRAVVRTLRVLPTDSRCLMRSLVLTALLARRGIDSRLVFGVRPGERFLAHAWVEREHRPLLDPAGSEFKRLLEL